MTGFAPLTSRGSQQYRALTARVDPAETGCNLKLMSFDLTYFELVRLGCAVRSEALCGFEKTIQKWDKIGVAFGKELHSCVLDVRCQEHDVRG